jgi:hypothetical protein
VVDDADHAIMAQIDRQYLARPITACAEWWHRLTTQSHRVNRKGVRRLM